VTARTLLDDAAALQEHLVALRRDFHAHPELAFEEQRTAAAIEERLRSLGMEPERIGGTGVLAILRGEKRGRTVLLRSDIDAVEQTEAPGREYGSRNPGRNHSCGHDVDITITLGAAALLAERRSNLAGSVAFLFQPADEPMTGARHLIAEGLWQRVKPDAILGMHIASDVEAGRVVANTGVVWASMDTMTIRLSPASTPADINLAAAHVVSSLYAALGSATTMLQPATFAVTAIDARQPRGGAAEARIELRLAAFDNGLRSELLKRIEEVAVAVSGGYGASVKIEHGHQIPAIINDATVATAVAGAARALLGEDAIIVHRHTVADDFSILLEQAPGCMVLFGTANPSKGITAMWHTPEYDCDEDILHKGAAVMAESALRLLR